MPKQPSTSARTSERVAYNAPRAFDQRRAKWVPDALLVRAVQTISRKAENLVVIGA